MPAKRHFKDFQVHYYELNSFHEATPVTILKYLEESAISHSEAAGYGFERLKQDGVGWVLNRWLLRVDKYPTWNQNIQVETWPSSFDKFYATREFHVKDEMANIIARASSQWIFINIASKRPIRIPECFGEDYGVDPDRAIQNPFSQIESVRKPEITKEFDIRRSDIDTNNHVNNTKFVEWALETVTDDTYQNAILTELEVIYRKEVSYGSSVISCSQLITEDADKYTYIHSISDITDGKELASIKAIWSKR